MLGAKEQVIKPYMFEPIKGDQCKVGDNSSEDNGSEDEQFDEEFEAVNASHRTTLDWCKCSKCAMMEKTMKAVEYDEYDKKLASAQNQDFSCITSQSSFKQNMLSKAVLDIDVSQ